MERALQAVRAIVRPDVPPGTYAIRSDNAGRTRPRCSAITTTSSASITSAKIVGYP